MSKCPKCDGRNHYQSRDSTTTGNLIENSPCYYCKGSGRDPRDAERAELKEKAAEFESKYILMKINRDYWRTDACRELKDHENTGENLYKESQAHEKTKKALQRKIEEPLSPDGVVLAKENARLREALKKIKARIRESDFGFNAVAAEEFYLIADEALKDSGSSNGRVPETKRIVELNNDYMKAFLNDNESSTPSPETNEGKEGDANADNTGQHDLRVWGTGEDQRSICVPTEQYYYVLERSDKLKSLEAERDELKTENEQLQVDWERNQEGWRKSTLKLKQAQADAAALREALHNQVRFSSSESDAVNDVRKILYSTTAGADLLEELEAYRKIGAPLKYEVEVNNVLGKLEEIKDRMAKLEKAHKEEVEELKKEIETDDKLLLERNKVLKAIPGCNLHGLECVPHAVEWIDQTKDRMAKLEKVVEEAKRLRERMKEPIVTDTGHITKSDCPSLSEALDDLEK